MVGTVPMDSTIPLPRRHLHPSAWTRYWYENELGWPTVPAEPGEPVRLVTGVRFDVLDVPAEAGAAALGRLGPGSPVALQGDRMRLLVAAGSAEELPGLLGWLEWGTLALDIVALGVNGRMDAPPPSERASAGPRPVPRGRSRSMPAAPVPGALQGAAVWLRPPGPGRGAGTSLPTLSAMGGVGGAPDLVRLVDTVATHCHRIRLRRGCAAQPVCQPLAFS
ncbi:SCO3374 family protein [Streptomyces sp. NPDC058964]|uniref:SCO3374 family protein n=1 Tax=Streptomyces sp. NPDC058964 TaxID=3346681 RepID=UPI0036775644